MTLKEQLFDEIHSLVNELTSLVLDDNFNIHQPQDARKLQKIARKLLTKRNQLKKVKD